jgi:hypothetical protein
LTATRSKTRHPWRYLLFVAGIFFLVIAAYVGHLIRTHEPDFYRPVRTAVVDARYRLSESFAHQAAAVEQLRLVHRDLNDAMTHLYRAELSDPADRQELEQLRGRLQELKDTKSVESMTTEQLKQSYQELSHDLDVLIARLQRRP